MSRAALPTDPAGSIRSSDRRLSFPFTKAASWLTCLLGFFLGITPAEAQEGAGTAQTVIPLNGMRIEANTVLTPGLFILDQEIEIVADGVTLDGNGAVLIGRTHSGTALLVRGRRNVTIRNLNIRRFRHGIRLERCVDSTIASCRIRDTKEIEPDSTFLDIWTPADRAYGAGILLIDCRNITVTDNDLQHQQNGLSLYGCEGCTITANNASFCSGWGIHLNASSRNVIRSNVADWCCRIFVRPKGGYHAGADAAALLMVNGSSRNTVERNLFRGGGDGVFLAGYHAPDVRAPCDDNRFVENDCSFSPNNAFEATFSNRNRFERNLASNSNYGFWLGYSTETVVRGNQIHDNRSAGVAIEHGRGNLIDRNAMRRNRTAVQLWTDSDPEFVSAFPDLAGSRDNRIIGNRIEHGHIGVSIWTDENVVDATCAGDRVLRNRFIGNRIGARFSRAQGALIRGNRFEDHAEVGVVLTSVTDYVVCDNYFDNTFNARAEDGINWTCADSGDEPSLNVLGGRGVGGNYWSDYAGTDQDGDGIGDSNVPYQPVGVTDGGDESPLVRR